MNKINLTQVFLLLVLGGISFFSVSQCAQKNQNKKAFEETLSQLQDEKRNSVSIVAYERLNLINDSLHTNIKELRTSQKATERLYKQHKAELGKITSDSLYKRLKRSRELRGQLYDIDSTILVETEMVKLDLIECDEINDLLVSEVDILEKAIGEYVRSGGELVAELEDCELNVIDLEGDVMELEMEVKKKKTQVWTNRGIVGAGLVVLLILL